MDDNNMFLTPTSTSKEEEKQQNQKPSSTGATSTMKQPKSYQLHGKNDVSERSILHSLDMNHKKSPIMFSNPFKEEDGTKSLKTPKYSTATTTRRSSISSSFNYPSAHFINFRNEDSEHSKNVFRDCSFTLHQRKRKMLSSSSSTTTTTTPQQHPSKKPELPCLLSTEVNKLHIFSPPSSNTANEITSSLSNKQFLPMKRKSRIPPQEEEFQTMIPPRVKFPVISSHVPLLPKEEDIEKESQENDNNNINNINNNKTLRLRPRVLPRRTQHLML